MSTATELEHRLTATLRAKADQVTVDDATFDPIVTSTVAPDPKGRGWWPAAVAAAVVLVVAVAIGFVVRTGGDKGAPAAEPTGAPVAELTITATDALRYEPEELTTVAGINEIQLLEGGGTHTLVFDDPALSYFELSVPSGPSRGKVELQAGRDYTFGCVIPGHRDAGMAGVIHVLPDAAPPKLTGTEQQLEIVPVPSAVSSVLGLRSFEGDVVPGTLFAVRVGGGPGVALYDDVNGTLAGLFDRVETVPGEGTSGVGSVYVRPGQVLLASNWPTAGRQTYVWPHVPAGTAFVTYELGSEKYWQRAKHETAVFDVTRPEQFDEENWRDATAPVLRAWDARGTLLRQVEAPRMVGDDHEVVTPG